MKFLNLIITIALLLVLSSCERESTLASYNLSADADQFKIFRRVVFYNGITNEYILQIEGYCSIEVDTIERQLEIVVKDNGLYKKHFLGLSDNVTYFAEQIEPSSVNKSQYKVIFKPLSIIPDIDVVK